MDDNLSCKITKRKTIEKKSHNEESFPIKKNIDGKLSDKIKKGK
jgi:hypothetical protein